LAFNRFCGHIEDADNAEDKIKGATNEDDEDDDEEEDDGKFLQNA
jgi:hypothetical protein